MTGIIYGTIHEIYTLGSETRISYGIAAYSDAETGSTASVIAAVRDISSDREQIDSLVALCNRYRLDPMHLTDIVEDFLAS